MRSMYAIAGLACLVMSIPSGYAQISSVPFIESFDGGDSPPEGWQLAGFEVSPSTPRTPPHCILSRGNFVRQYVTFPPFDPAKLAVRELRWFERRSASAQNFRLTVSFRSGIDKIPLAEFSSLDAENSYRERRVTVPRMPDGTIAEGWFEIAIEADSTNTTGVVRIDDVGYLVETRFDAALGFVPPEDVVRFVGEEVPMTFLIRNAHDEQAIGIQLNVSWTSGDPADDHHSLFWIPPIAGHDSAVIPWVFRSDIFGTASVTAAVIWPPDENTANDTVRTKIRVAYPPGSLRVSEFMYAPVREDEPEWVEILNPGPHVVDGLYLTISDKGSQRLEVSDTPFLLVPGQYAVLSSSPGLTDMYDTGPTPIVVLRLPALNNSTPDAIVLRDAFGTTLDSVAYRPEWGRPGMSLERRDWDLPSADSSTWAPTVASAGGTPGRTNSVQRVAVDLKLEEVRAISERPGEIGIRIGIRNDGRGPVSGGSVSCTVVPGFDPGRSFAPAPLPIGPIQPDAKADLDAQWTIPLFGAFRIVARISVAGDTDSSNDTASTDVSVPYPQGALLVNEVMFNPFPGESEWIEVQNMTGQDIPLEGWSMLDLPTVTGSRTRVVCSSPAVVPANGLGVIAADSTCFVRFPWLREEAYRGRVLVVNRSGGLGLNSSEDGVVLSDLTGATIDSVLYSESWHNPSVVPRGRSLERLRTDLPGTLDRAWTSSPSRTGGTPGKPNVSLPPAGDPGAGLTVEPNPFSPDGDGREDLVYLRYSYPTPSAFVRARIYDDTGLEIRSLANGSFFGGADLLTWDGRDERGRRVKRGAYILFLEAWNTAERFSVTEKRVIVVAR